MESIVYVPVLKSKQSELRALKYLEAEIKNKILPLIDLAAPSTDQDLADPVSYVEKSILKLGDHLNKFKHVILDSSELESDFRVTGNVHPLRAAAEALQGAVDSVIPTTGLSRDMAHLNALIEICELSRNDIICIRLDAYDLETPSETANNFNNFVNEHLKNYKVIVLLDFECVYGFESALISEKVIRIEQKLDIPNKIFTAVIGCGIPKNIKQAVGARSSGYIPRVEVEAFNQLNSKKHNGKFVFGDYAIVNPQYVQLDYRIINKVMGPKIFYALSNAWFVIRGGSFDAHPDKYNQYYDLAKEVSKLPDFSGGDYSYGDQYIELRSNDDGSTGNPASWLVAGINRHVTFSAKYF
ncbi:MAG: beta family protein [Gammaproteobacteria bacterium]|nr:beta family protein [Gammaproteobacteria bacterium]